MTDRQVIASLLASAANARRHAGKGWNNAHYKRVARFALNTARRVRIGG